MSFKHEFYPRTELLSEDTSTGRRYTLPDGTIVDSVTTVLGKSKELPKEWLDKWKKRVGEEKANQISGRAKVRGTAVHSIIEKYLRNDINYAKVVMPVILSDFTGIKLQLDMFIDEIYGIELPLYSYTLKTAGKADLFAKWDGKNSIIDFKTSLKPKKHGDILGYFLQAATYAWMASNTYSIPVDNIVVAIVVSHDAPQIFEERIENYIPIIKKIFNA